MNFELKISWNEFQHFISQKTLVRTWAVLWCLPVWTFLYPSLSFCCCLFSNGCAFALLIKINQAHFFSNLNILICLVQQMSHNTLYNTFDHTWNVTWLAVIEIEYVYTCSIYFVDVSWLRSRKKSCSFFFFCFSVGRLVFTLSSTMRQTLPCCFFTICSWLALLLKFKQYSSCCKLTDSKESQPCWLSRGRIKQLASFK